MMCNIIINRNSKKNCVLSKLNLFKVRLRTDSGEDLVFYLLPLTNFIKNNLPTTNLLRFSYLQMHMSLGAVKGFGIKV